MVSNPRVWAGRDDMGIMLEYRTYTKISLCLDKCLRSRNWDVKSPVKSCHTVTLYVRWHHTIRWLDIPIKRRQSRWIESSLAERRCNLVSSSVASRTGFDLIGSLSYGRGMQDGEKVVANMQRTSSLHIYCRSSLDIEEYYASIMHRWRNWLSRLSDSS